MSELKQLEMQKDDEMEIDLGEIFHLLMNKLWIIVLCFIIGATLAFGGTKLLITPKYSASSMIYILTKTTSVTSLADIQMGTQLTADFEILATSRPVLEEVIEKLNLDYTYEELKSMIQTDNQTDTRILRFTVLDANAKEAKKIANELADVTAERVAYVMSSDKPKVVEEAVVPKYPSSPNTKKNTAMGGLAFAFVAATVIVLRYLMNDTIQTEEDIKKAILEKTVFGRVTPNQKRQFVQALKEAGKTVAMTGDGVNDVLALKDADCSIAMASGSEAAAQASQIVLLESDFSCMPQVVLEGRRVVNNIQRSASLFLVKNIFSFLLSLFSVVFMFTYPLEPSQVSLISMFTIGIPAFFLALEPNKNIIKGHFLTNVFLKALPAALTDALAVGALVVFGKTFGVGEQDISTAATMLLAIVGFMILYKISAPMNKLRAGILGGCIAGLLFCSIYLNQLFAITGMTTKCIMLFVVFAIATEPVLRYLTILLGKGRFYYRRLRGKTSLEEEA